MIVAMGRNGVIGREGSIPWKIPADLRHFRTTTMNHAVVMGRKTWESLGRPLPGRLNIVLTSQKDYQVPSGVTVVRTLDEALSKCSGDPEPFVIGGGEIYRLALPLAQRIYRTIVDLAPVGDATFPELGDSWHVVRKQHYPPGSDDTPAFSIQVLERIGSRNTANP